ncbi:MAG: methylase [Cenarchaeum symbiont of Oopsacas minuta]|nr:methylase [Cenarchaeum symbiont of Oopsacas minuta]
MASKNKPYLPAEDTYFLEDGIRGESGLLALEIGTGPGYITRVLERTFETVVGTDINLEVLRGRSGKLVCCDGAGALRNNFEVIVCNMPYLATDEIDDIATDGGPEGVVIPSRIIHSAIPRLAKGGRFYFVTSSLSNYTILLKEVQKCGAKAEIIFRKKLFFEELLLVCCTV